ncbi:MAG: glycosyltransferase family 2 protein [Pseudomonadota bacterium]
MKISIIIPTRERAYYLKSSIQTVLDIKDDNIELIVADNASTDGTRQVVAGFDDPRLIYLPSERRVSMRENFNRSVLGSSGDYVLIFGDDDAIVPGQFKYLRQIAEDRRPDAVTWGKAGYYWPVENYGKNPGTIRFYRSRSFGPIFHYDPSTQIEPLLECNFSVMNPPPHIYHGCVSRAYLDRISPKPDLYFDGVIPDVNFQFRAIFEGGDFWHVHHPFTINGASPASNGSATVDVKAASGSPKIAQAFNEENKVDPYDDVIDHAQTIDLVIFSTLETLRERGGYGHHRPNFRNWYKYGLNAVNRRPDLEDRIMQALNQHAEKTNTQSELAQAASAVLPKRTFSQRLQKALGQVGTFKLDTELDGENTVLNAARIMDAVLGDGFDAVVSGTSTKSAAWRKAKQAAKSFL